MRQRDCKNETECENRLWSDVRIHVRLVIDVYMMGNVLQHKRAMKALNSLRLSASCSGPSLPAYRIHDTVAKQRRP